MIRAATQHASASPERLLRLLVIASALVPAIIFVGSALLSYASHFAQAESRLRRTVDILYEHAAKVFETLDLAAGQVELLLAGLTDEEIHSREAELHQRIKSLTAPLDQVQFVLVLDGTNHPLVFSGMLPAARDVDYSNRD